MRARAIREQDAKPSSRQRRGRESESKMRFSLNAHGKSVVDCMAMAMQSTSDLHGQPWQRLATAMGSKWHPMASPGFPRPWAASGAHGIPWDAHGHAWHPHGHGQQMAPHGVPWVPHGHGQQVAPHGIPCDAHGHAWHPHGHGQQVAPHGIPLATRPWPPRTSKSVSRKALLIGHLLSRSHLLERTWH